MQVKFEFKTRQRMKLQWTKKQKLPFFRFFSGFLTETNLWLSRCAAGKKSSGIFYSKLKSFWFEQLLFFKLDFTAVDFDATASLQIEASEKIKVATGVLDHRAIQNCFWWQNINELTTALSHRCWTQIGSDHGLWYWEANRGQQYIRSLIIHKFFLLWDCSAFYIY